LIFGAEFRSALPAALVLVIASGIASLNSVGAECLRGLGRPGSALRAECAGLAVTAIALPALIPLAGIVGAACASVLAYSATLIVQQRELSAPGENAILDVTAGVPPTLDPVA
jgi:O-antigen/teichoic acid export membrane protein